MGSIKFTPSFKISWSIGGAGGDVGNDLRIGTGCGRCCNAVERQGAVAL